MELLENKPNRKSFRTSCDCNDIDHTLWVELEYDKEIKDLFLTFFVETIPIHCYQYEFSNKLKRFWYNLKFCFFIMFGKSVIFEGSFIFRGKRHISDFINHIQTLGQDCEWESNELHRLRQKIYDLKKGE